MKCEECRRSVAAGIEAQRMVAEYLQDDGTAKLFGHQMPGGPIAKATGRLVNGWHNRCFHARRRRQARDDAAASRALDFLPTSYDVAQQAITGEDRRALGLAETEAHDRVAGLADELHARAALRRTTEQRLLDPAYAEPASTDWREQTQADI